MFKKTLNFVIITGLLLLFINILPALSFDIEPGYGLNKVAKSADYSTSSENNVYSIINIVIKVILGALGIIFFVLITVSGIQWMTAQGNEEKVSTAKLRIEAAVVGIVIIAAAYAATNYAFQLFS